MNLILFLRKLSLISLAAILLPNCKKEVINGRLTTEEATASSASVGINIITISPTSGPGTTVVAIKSSTNKFSTNKDDLIVKFNGVQAAVNSATLNEIVATVPRGAGTGPVTILVNGNQYTTFQNFTYTWITSVTTDPHLVTFPKGIAIDPFTHKLKSSAMNFICSPTTDDPIYAGMFWPGFRDGMGADAMFDGPAGITVINGQDLLVADRSNHRIRKVSLRSTFGNVTTWAGTGINGSGDGARLTAQFSNPSDVVADDLQNVYVAEYSRIRKISPAGTVSTVAGSGTSGFANGSGTTAKFNRAEGIAVDGAGNIYVADFYNHRIRKITPSGYVTTFAGSGAQGFADGEAAKAKFNNPCGLAFDKEGNLLVADFGNHRIRKVTPSGAVSTIAGSGTAGTLDGNGLSAQFRNPCDIAISDQGTIYISDHGNNRIRVIQIY